MKIKGYMMLLSAAAMLTSCDLDTFPEGDVLTSDQKNEVIADDPSKIASDMNSLKSIMTQWTDNGQHTDFAFPAISLFTDCSGQDMVSEDHGYNWFSPGLTFKDRIATAHTPNFMWKTYYTHIKASNDVLKVLLNIEEEKRDAKTNNYIGQALASRAYDYMQLIQYFQFTYLGHEDALGLPIVVEDTPDEKGFDNPRVPVKEVYAMIMRDLDKAVKCMEENPVEMEDKAQITAAVAYGLRARANMLMGKYAEAASDADKALELSNAQPYSMEEVSVPSFNEDNHSWLWGIVITEQNDVVQTGIVNWPSHLCSLTGNGYTTGVGVDVVFKRINSDLYAKMGETDVRKGWWINPETHDSPMLTKAYGFGNQVIKEQILGIAYPDYTNVKFGPEANQAFNPNNAQDWPLMRAEEMLLIKAEALGRANGVAEGKNVLESFVKSYRDPEYVCKATNVDELVDEVWVQRRLELWGEGFSLQDILRLKKPVVRKGTNFNKNVTYEDIKAEDPILIYNIPESETNVNKGIGEDQINEVATVPTPLM